MKGMKYHVLHKIYDTKTVWIILGIFCLKCMPEYLREKISLWGKQQVATADKFHLKNLVDATGCFPFLA